MIQYRAMKPKPRKDTKGMTPEEKKFIEQARKSGKRGSAIRWGDHGPTKSVRAFAATVDRFRDAIPQERDRAAAATAALDDYLNKRAKSKPSADGITINAALTFHWYDEIDKGSKRIEYREIGPYWDAKLWDNGITERIAAIRFSRGYTNTRMTWEVTKITRNEDEGVYEIHLGKRLA